VFPISAQKQPSKDEMFQQIAKLTNTKKAEDQAKAYQMSKDFLAQYGKENDDKVKKIRDYVQKYRLNEFNKALDDVRLADALKFGQDILADEPENPYVTMNLAYVGYEAFNKKQDKSFSQQSVSFAKRTLDLLEAGKTPNQIAPFKDLAEVNALMYYVIGTFSLDTDIKEAARNFYKSTQFESQIKKNSYPYYVIAVYYERQYETAVQNFRTKHGSKTAVDEAMKADQEAMNKIIDRMLDAYARAVKLAETETNPLKDSWKQRLTQIYQFRKGSDAGMNDLLNSILNTPMPEPN
jgi:transcription initiation factor TFIIIB Brf1 subunit/transcription initiation factor TFIIB